MKPTSDLSNKTKAELTALARRKKIPVTSGMLKDELIKTIKKVSGKSKRKKNPRQPKKTQKRRARKPLSLKLRANPKPLPAKPPLPNGLKPRLKKPSAKKALQKEIQKKRLRKSLPRVNPKPPALQKRLQARRALNLWKPCPTCQNGMAIIVW